MCDSETETARLHGTWNETGSQRWCQDCGEWVPATDWKDHERAFGEESHG